MKQAYKYRNIAAAILVIAFIGLFFVKSTHFHHNDCGECTGSLSDENTEAGVEDDCFICHFILSCCTENTFSFPVLLQKITSLESFPQPCLYISFFFSAYLLRGPPAG